MCYDIIENWGWDANSGSVVKEMMLDPYHIFANGSCNLMKGSKINKSPPFTDFVHATGNAKPWLSDPDELEHVVKDKSWRYFPTPPIGLCMFS